MAREWKGIFLPFPKMLWLYQNNVCWYSAQNDVNRFCFGNETAASFFSFVMKGLWNLGIPSGLAKDMLKKFLGENSFVKMENQWKLCLVFCICISCLFVTFYTKGDFTTTCFCQKFCIYFLFKFLILNILSASYFFFKLITELPICVPVSYLQLLWAPFFQSSVSVFLSIFFNSSLSKNL